MTAINIYDFTEMTCTNLMIKIKVLKNKIKVGEFLEFLTTREGLINIEKILNKVPFKMISEQKNSNVFYVKCWKTE